MFKYPDSDWKKIIATRRAGKATGKEKNWLNVSDGETSWSLDWSGVEEWKVVDDSDIDGKESKEEFSGCEGRRGVKWGSGEGDDRAGCVRDNHENFSDGGQADGTIVNENQSDVNGTDVRSDNDSCDDISVTPVKKTQLNQIELYQIEYIEQIGPIQMSRDRHSNKKEVYTKEESFQFRQLVGKLNWIAIQSHPDIAFGVCILSSTMKNPKIENAPAATKLLRKVKEQPMRINFSNLSDLGNIQLICFSDASLANLPSGRSSGGDTLRTLSKRHLQQNVMVSSFN